MNVDTVLDLEWLRSATFDDLQAAARLSSQDKSKLTELNATLASPEGKVIAQDMSQCIRAGKAYVPPAIPPEAVDEEEAAQIAADTARADAEAAEAERIAEEQRAVLAPVVATADQEAESTELAKLGIALHKDSAGNITKIVQDYQVKDDAGRPIGRPTHLEAKSWPELVSKQKAAHENAVRYAERTKQNQLKSRDILAQTEQVTQQATKARAEADEAVAEAAKEPAKLGEALRKVTHAESKSVEASRTAAENQMTIVNDWLADHEHNYLNCQANTDIIGAWLKENNRKLSYENLDVAFKANEHRLAKPIADLVAEPAVVAPNAPTPAPAAPVPVPSAIPAPVIVSTVPASTPAPSASQPVVAAPVVTPAAATNTPAARRPGVNGSLPPGTLTAARPSVEQKPQTTTRAALLKAINKMSSTEYRQKLKTSAEFRAQHDAVGIAY